MSQPWQWYVYIIECLDGSFYTGMTWNPAVRYEQHLSKFGSKYTAKHGVRRLAYLEMHENLEGARRRERLIKDYRREKKLKLITGEWERWS